MGDLKNPRLIYLKGVLFLLIAVMSSWILIARNPALLTAALVALTAWSSARFYYFAFYVIERYVDPTYRFAGLGSLIRFALQKRLPKRGQP